MKGCSARRRTVGLVVILLTGCFPFGAEATTTGSIEGLVTDSSGAVLAGAGLHLSSEVLMGGTQHVVADEKGGFAFRQLPPGPYTLRAEMPGYSSAELSTQVRLGRVAEIRVELASATFEGEIAISAAPALVDVSRVDIGEVWDESLLKRATIGIDGRSMLGAINKEAGVSGGSRPTIMGSTYSENLFLVDGLNTTDPMSGRVSLDINFDALQEISIHTGGFEAEYGQAIGGVINAVTKSGGNQLSGTLDLRYRDENMSESGDYFDPDQDPSSKVVGSATLGGPIQRDRLWYFTSVLGSREERSPYLAPLSITSDRFSWLAKLTWQATDSNRLVAKATSDDYEMKNGNASMFVAPDAGVRTTSGVTVAQAGLDSMLNHDFLLDLHLGYNSTRSEYEPMHGNFEIPRTLNYTTGISSGSPGYVEQLSTDSAQLRSSLTWLGFDTWGSHEVKAGLEYRKIQADQISFLTGDMMLFEEVYDPDDSQGGSGHHDEDGDGIADYMLITADPLSRTPTHSEGELWSLFLQDDWRPIPSLTIKPGLRWDKATYVNDQERDILDVDSLQPRLGMAWDINGGGKNVVRLNVGRFMHPATVNIANVASGRSWGQGYYMSFDWYCSYYDYCDPAYLEFRYGEPFVVVDDEADEHLYYMWREQWFTPFESVESLGYGSLNTPIADQLVVGSEHRLWSGASLELMYVYKRTRNLIEDTCLNNTWVWGDGEEPTFDDPDSHTDPDGCTGYVLANAPMLERDYEAAIVKLESRSQHFHLYANYTWSVSEGSSEATADYAYTTEEFDAYPRDFYNVYGYNSDDRRHRVKVYGYLLLPLDFIIGFDAWWASEPALNRTITCNQLGGTPTEILDDLGVPSHWYWEVCAGWFTGDVHLEPRGSRRGEDNYQIDLQVTKGFSVGSVDLSAIFTVINVLSSEQPTEYKTTELYGVPWGTPLEYQQPRRYEVGFRLEF